MVIGMNRLVMGSIVMVVVVAGGGDSDGRGVVEVDGGWWVVGSGDGNG